jgi:hypothetical protein
MAAPPRDNTTKVLLALRDGAAEGYALMSKTSLDHSALAEALRELLAQEIIFVRGDLGPERVGDAYVSVRPSARGRVEQMLFRQTL